MAARHNTPRWAWAILGVLAAYQGVMYGGLMRQYMNVSVILMPWLLRQPGYRLYDNVILQHAPGNMWLGMLLYPLIPDPVLRVRVMMVLVAGLSTGVIFWLARRWWGPAFGLVAAAFYAVWGPVVMDRPMYFEVSVGLLALLAVTVWHRPGGEWWRPALAGLLVGSGLVFKQQALTVVAVFVIWRVLAFEWRGIGRGIALFLIPAALPVGVVLLALGAQGRLADALFWTWAFNFQTYADVALRFRPPASEIAIWLAFLGLVPLFAIFVVPRREQWRREGILLLGLVPALASTMYPRYGRMHLSGVIPIVALVSGGALAYAQGWLAGGGRKTWLAWGLRLYQVGAAGLLLIALALPTYYRVKLGPLRGEYEAMVPISHWVREEVGATSGTRVWMVVEIDPTDNFYVVDGFLPPSFWSQTYSWYYAAPGMAERMLDGLETDPPAYAVVIEKWRNQVPTPLVDYLEARYAVVSQAEMPHGIGAVTLYALSTSG